MTIRVSSSITNISFLALGLSFAFLAQIGFYGYGKDFFYSYSYSNINYANPNFYSFIDILGWYFATFTIFNVHIGIFITSAVLALGVGKLLLSKFNSITLNQVLFLLIIYIFLLHTWPVIMATSNAMRQGLSMGVFYLFIAKMDSNGSSKVFLFLLFFLMALFHKSGIIFIYLFFLIYLNKRYLPFSSKITTMAFYLIFCIAIGVVLKQKWPDPAGHAVGLDLTIPFLIIGTGYLYAYLFHRKNPDYSSDFLVALIFFNFTLTFLGFNWQVERLWMMSIILIMIELSILLKGNQKVITLFWLSALLFVFTFASGMYSNLSHFGQLYENSKAVVY